MKSTISNRIKEIRGKKSQEVFAEEMGCSFRAYRYYESGERTPPGDVLVALSKASGKSIDWILTGVEKADSVREVRGTYLTTEEKLIEIVHALSEKDRLDILEFAEFKQKKHLKED